MRTAIGLILLLGLGACASVPSDGPSAHALRSQSSSKPANYAIVDLDYGVARRIEVEPSAALAGLREASSAAPVDLIAEGDVLAVSVFEAGAGGLFTRPTEAASSPVPQTFPRAVVDSQGQVAIPYAGEIHVAGLTPAAAQEAIRRALRGKALNPQVTVGVVESRANAVTVIGEVRTAGRFPLADHADRLLDVIAAAGGATKPPADVAVVVVRGDRIAESAYGDVMRTPAENIRLAPQDQVRIVYRPRRYTAFGAFGRVAEIPIEDDSLSLASAMSRAGGLDTNSANAGSVLVFRFERPEVARALGVTQTLTPKGAPVVYRLNLRNPEGFFVASSFRIEPNDILYVPRSNITEAKKFLDVINVISQVTYNVEVTSVLHH